ncbi:General negative regulator of transcription subunit 4 [Morella rubra]|uniref:General negative regulator of transcription subunit 4 n=1 Tax=Morella rubra TaxID=262757 RepID=A0A6A1VG09_9ROSI|nr:General negative regulator of transcription subunit 4 [Morella rubra]
MGSESISVSPAPATLPKDLSKKKRTNKKLKQSKLDVRREQWLSQVKKKGCKVDSNVSVDSQPSRIRIANVHNGSSEKMEMGSRGEENERSSIHDGDLESQMNGRIGSSFDHHDSRKGLGGSSSSSVSSGCCSGSISEEEEDDGCLDDWEAIADALNADDIQHNSISKLPENPETRLECGSNGVPSGDPRVDLLKKESKEVVSESLVNCRAWRADDTFRPQSLPTLSKQNSFPMTSDWHCGRGTITWAWQSIMSQPSPCPICYEDLDVTDSSFLPCSCGFRLCLFCHKRILEADGRCPGCRKQYDHINADFCFTEGLIAPFRVSHSCSMSSRS